jgi:prepilin-type N-terminal cleavage/methylation domain-containing protein
MLSQLHRIKQRRAAEGMDEGFTLIELLIVIVVLGILAAVVVLSLGGVTGNAAKSACESDLATVNTAAAAYNAQTGAYPTNTAQLTGVTPPYLQTWPSSSHYAITIDPGTHGGSTTNFVLDVAIGTAFSNFYGTNGTTTNTAVTACSAVS